MNDTSSRPIMRTIVIFSQYVCSRYLVQIRCAVHYKKERKRRREREGHVFRLRIEQITVARRRRSRGRSGSLTADRRGFVRGVRRRRQRRRRRKFNCMSAHMSLYTRYMRNRKPRRSVAGPGLLKQEILIKKRSYI